MPCLYRQDDVLLMLPAVPPAGITNILVGAMDAQIGQAMVKAGINSFAMYEQRQNHSGVGHDHLQWGGESFHKMVRAQAQEGQVPTLPRAGSVS